MLTRILSSVYPRQVDSDDQLPFILDHVTDISSFHINALKDSIIAIEKTLGYKPAGEFSTVKQRMSDVENKFVKVSGDIMTGDLGVNGTSISNIYFGNNKESAISWGDSTTVTLLDGIFENGDLTLTEELNATPFVFIGTAADGTSSAELITNNGFLNSNDVLYTSLYNAGNPISL